MSATATISEYERQRAQRIHDNQLRIKQLGIVEAVAAVRPKPVAQAAPRPKRTREDQQAGPIRKSARNEGKPVPVYITMAEPGERAQRAPKLARRPGTASFRKGINPDSFPHATVGACDEAYDAAQALADELNEKAGFVVAATKMMQVSNVSGGFWLQNPQAVTENLGTDKRDIQLECLEPCQHQDEYKLGLGGSQTRWSVVYLPRKSGSGMSGGWINFAIDHALTPNDTVVFEVMSGSDAKIVRAHIFRAKLSSHTSPPNAT